LVAIGGGCAAAKPSDGKIPESRTRVDRHAAEESTFAAGAGRAPTAATSFSFAKILVAQGRDRDALYVLSHIIREHPKYLPAYNEMAGVYMRADRLDDAIAALEVGMEHSPNDGVLHNNLGMCYLLKEDPQRALASFTRATEIVPNSATFRSNRAAALALTAHDSEAETEYRRVVGSLEARQNVIAIARARDSRSETNDPQSSIGKDAAQPVRPAAVGSESPALPPAPAAKPQQPVIQTRAPISAAITASSPPSPPPKFEKQLSTATPAAIETSHATPIVHAPDKATPIQTPAAAPAGDTGIRTLGGAAGLGVIQPPLSSAEKSDRASWIAPVPNDLNERGDKAADPDGPL
jgi:Flp pilus assembly protein TadD